MTTTNAREQRLSWRNTALVLVAAVLAVLTFAGPASAHDALISSDPAADTVLAKPPTKVTLVFDQQVQNLYAEMAITIGLHTPVAFTPTVSGRDVTADLAAQDLNIPSDGAMVAWRIGYRVISADGHPVTGLVNFTVGTAAAGAPSTATPPSAVALAGSSGGAPWVLIGGAAVAVLIVAAVVLLLMRRRSSPDY